LYFETATTSDTDTKNKAKPKSQLITERVYCWDWLDSMIKLYWKVEVVVTSYMT